MGKSIVDHDVYIRSGHQSAQAQCEPVFTSTTFSCVFLIPLFCVFHSQAVSAMQQQQQQQPPPMQPAASPVAMETHPLSLASPVPPTDPMARKQVVQDLMAQMQGTYNFMQVGALCWEQQFVVFIKRGAHHLVTSLLPGLDAGVWRTAHRPCHCLSAAHETRSEHGLTTDGLSSRYVYQRETSLWCVEMTSLQWLLWFTKV